MLGNGTENGLDEAERWVALRFALADPVEPGRLGRREDRRSPYAAWGAARDQGGGCCRLLAAFSSEDLVAGQQPGGGGDSADGPAYHESVNWGASGT